MKTVDIDKDFVVVRRYPRDEEQKEIVGTGNTKFTAIMDGLNNTEDLEFLDLESMKKSKYNDLYERV